MTDKQKEPNAPAAASAPGQPVLWCLHIRSSDDVHPAPDYETAQLWADRLFERFDIPAMKEGDQNQPLLRAVAAPYPWDAESHAAGLAKSIAEWSVPGDAAPVAPATAAPLPSLPTLVHIPAGQFLMGSPEDEPGRYPNEGPQHLVTIKPFAIGRYPVTFDEWNAFAAATGGYQPSDKGWGRGRRPVINVSWDDAQAYLAWLRVVTGEPYRLPSEAEWEYACRAGTSTPFHTGQTITTEQANFDGDYTYNGSVKGDFRKQTVPVGSFPPNSFGLYDMHGNVWEWCEDYWSDNYSMSPTDGYVNAKAHACRVLRGGSWYNYPYSLRSAERYWNALDYRNFINGFRVARTITY